MTRRVRMPTPCGRSSNRRDSSSRPPASTRPLAAASSSARNDIEAVRRSFEQATQAHQALTYGVSLERQARDDEARRQAEAPRESDADRVAERQAQLAVVERLPTAVRAMDSGRSLTDVLSALDHLPLPSRRRVALFVVNGPELRSWKTVGFDSEAVQASLNDQGLLLAEVMRRREPVVSAEGDGPAAPRAHRCQPTARRLPSRSWWPHSRWRSCMPTMRQPGLRIRRRRGPRRCNPRPSCVDQSVAPRRHAPRVACAVRQRLQPRAPYPTSEKEDGTTARRYARGRSCPRLLNIRGGSTSAGRSATCSRDSSRRSIGPKVIRSGSLRLSMHGQRFFNRSSCRRWPTATPRSWAITREYSDTFRILALDRHPGRRCRSSCARAEATGPPIIRPSHGMKAICGWCHRLQIVRHG